jgi:hypothetical protein
MEEHAIGLELRAEPSQLTVPTRDRLRLSVTATNEGAEVVDPELYRAELRVNGERSRAFALAIGNGRRDPKWFALPPGESVSMTWSSLGESLFPGVGEFTLVLAHDDREAEPVTVSVLPGQDPQ